MRKTLLFFAACIVLISSANSQDDRFSQLSEKNITGFTQPLATTLGIGINSGAFHSAYIPKTFGFSINLRFMYIMIPDDDLTFTPTLPAGYTADKPTATFYGNQGSSYLGQAGYITFPNGVDESWMPFGMPQVTASFMGTEALIRFIPTIKAGDEEFNFFGIGVKHSVSQYIPMFPLDIAVQVMYNKLSFSDILEGTNLAFNAHASKSFGPFTAYGGLQYESSNFDIEYTIEGDPNSGDPALRTDRDVSTEIEGENNFRFILGGSLKLAVLVLNADLNLGAQTSVTTGLSFEF